MGQKRKQSQACIGDDDERSRRRIVVVDKIRYSRNTHKTKKEKMSDWWRDDNSKP